MDTDSPWLKCGWELACSFRVGLTSDADLRLELLAYWRRKVEEIEQLAFFGFWTIPVYKQSSSFPVVHLYPDFPRTDGKALAKNRRGETKIDLLSDQHQFAEIPFDSIDQFYGWISECM